MSDFASENPVLVLVLLFVAMIPVAYLLSRLLR